jgi:hypothetical protein
MNRKADNELLDDVLAEAAPENLRETMLGETLRFVRRRRRFRQTRNMTGIFIALALLGIFIWQRDLSRKPIAAVPSTPKLIEKSYTLVRTRPLPSNEIVATHSLPGEQFFSSAQAVEIVQTTTGNFRVIDDEELLALVASHPAILVRTGPQSEKLVFANPDDAKGFPLN